MSNLLYNQAAQYTSRWQIWESQKASMSTIVLRTTNIHLSKSVSSDQIFQFSFNQPIGRDGRGQGGQCNETTPQDILIVTPSLERLSTLAREASSRAVRRPCCTPTQYFLVSAIIIFYEII